MTSSTRQQLEGPFFLLGHVREVFDYEVVRCKEKSASATGGITDSDRQEGFFPGKALPHQETTDVRSGAPDPAPTMT